MFNAYAWSPISSWCGFCCTSRVEKLHSEALSLLTPMVGELGRPLSLTSLSQNHYLQRGVCLPGIVFVGLAHMLFLWEKD
jgi:hypothetical protein